MITILYHRPAAIELMHPRVEIIAVQDAEQAATLLATLREAGVLCDATRGRVRLSVAALVAQRDRRLDRALAAATVARRRAALRPVAG